MAKRYRLLGRAQMDGEVRDAGYIFTLADGQQGPMRAVGMNSPTQRDEKLYEEVAEEEPVAEEATAIDPAPVDPAPAAADTKPAEGAV